LKITRKAATAAVASLSLLALAACSSGSSDDTDDDSGINQETAVNVAWESPLFETNTDSSNGNATQNAVITYLTNETFNFYDPDLKLQKNEGFGTYEKTSDDPLTVKYTLNDDAAWSDGTPVTAADLLLGWAGTSGALNTIEGSSDDEGNDTTDYTAGVYFDGVTPGAALVTKTPEISAQTPSRRSSRRSCSLTVSYSVDCPGAHSPTPMTAVVTRGSCANASATSRCSRRARAVPASGSVNGA